MNATLRTSTSTFFAINRAATASTTSCWDAARDKTIAGRIAFVTSDPKVRAHGYLLEAAHRILGEIRADLAAQRAEWEREVAEDRANGHRPHYCIHGVDMWVDHDCACGLCEDSDRDMFANPRLVIETAMWEAKRRARKFDEALDAIMSLHDEGLVDAPTRSEVISRAIARHDRPWGER